MLQNVNAYRQRQSSTKAIKQKQEKQKCLSRADILYCLYVTVPQFLKLGFEDGMERGRKVPKDFPILEIGLHDLLALAMGWLVEECSDV